MLKKNYFAIRLNILLALISITHAIRVTYIKTGKHITVFIHGTVWPELALLNPYKSYTQTITEHDWYYRCLSKIRENPELHYDSVMLNQGLHKIDPRALYQYTQGTLSPVLCKKAAYQAIGAYDTMAKLVQAHTEFTDYYTFGFLGLLSDTHRKKAAHELYTELERIRQKNNNEGYETHITLCGYSHGGTLLLYLAEAEEQQKKNLLIDTAILFGTPLNKHSAAYATHKIFNKIINIYSEGDYIQANDIISSRTGESFRTLSTFYTAAQLTQKLSTKIMCNVRMRIAHDTKAIDHFAYWSFDHYNNLDTDDIPVKTIYNALSPLPLVILTPVMLSVLQEAQKKQIARSYDIALTADNTKITLQALDRDTGVIYAESCNIEPSLSKIRSYALNTWRKKHHERPAKITTRILAALQTVNRA